MVIGGRGGWMIVAARHEGKRFVVLIEAERRSG
jgi:hypothetical protein